MLLSWTKFSKVNFDGNALKFDMYISSCHAFYPGPNVFCVPNFKFFNCLTEAHNSFLKSGVGSQLIVAGA
jgi:hypothetical protein